MPSGLAMSTSSRVMRMSAPASVERIVRLLQGKKLRVLCVYSTEQLVYPDNASCDSNGHGPQGLSCAGFGASMAVTASFGLVAVSQVLKQLAGKRR